ncbi:MAG TPA: hypothetical protein ENN67_04105, partial [Firmicutes bacterium]|nr:hypothetical protein [Bacillota bacterium]
MIRRPILLALFVTGMVISLACSGGSPTLPDSQENGLTNAQSVEAEAGSNKALWGYWDVIIDTQTWEVSVVPLRGVEFTCDVVRFMQPPLGQLSTLKITVTDMTEYLTQGLIDIDVSLTHPFPGMVQFTGFDVYGVFVSPGSVFGNYDSDVVYSNGVDDPILLNPDGYTRWQNPVEFNEGPNIFNFEPGALGNQNIALFNSTINGYKYFADGLTKAQTVENYYSNPNNLDKRGMFSPGSVNVREYDLKFPMVAGVPSLIFQYAVIASWIPADPTLTGDPGVIDVPGDFGPDANAHESFYVGVTNQSTLWKDGSANGGSVKLALEVFDWGAYHGTGDVPSEIYQIVVEGNASVIPGGYATFDQSYLTATAMPGSTAISSVFTVEISGCTPVSNDPFPVLITVESFDPETFDPGNGQMPNDDRLAAYLRYAIPILDESPSTLIVTSPNGGETLWMAMAHEITWDPGTSGITDVKIEWSTDNFVSDFREIVASTPNDGSYDWRPIPVVDTTTAKVRVSDVLGTEYDQSDNYFTIALPVWLEFQNEYHVPYPTNGYEFSPAIGQTTAGMVYVMFYGWLQGGSQTSDACAYSSNGTSWGVTQNYFGTGSGSGAPNFRADSAKIAPGHAGQAWVSICFNFGYFWVAQATTGGLGYYTFDGLNPVNYNDGKFTELATDSAGYLFLFGDITSGNAIYWRKSLQPGLYLYGGSGQMGGVQMLTGDGIVSHSRSWARQGQGLAFIYYTPSGKMILAETTDAPTNSTWDITETVWDGATAGYTEVKNPALCADSTGRLFAIWTGKHTASGEWRILSSMRETPSSSWTTPAIVTSSTSHSFDNLHISSKVKTLPGGVSEDVAVVTWDSNKKCSSALSPMDLMAWLPVQQVSLDGVDVMQPDVFCPGMNYVY